MTQRSLNTALIRSAAAGAVALVFLTIGANAVNLSTGQTIVLVAAAMGLLQVLFIPRWPRVAALKDVLDGMGKRPPGTTYTVESRGRS